MKELLSTSVIINAVLFQCAWFACVLGSAKGLTWPAALCFIALAIFQLQNKRRHSTDVRLLFVSVLLGLLIDSFWINAGIMSFTESSPVPQLAPAWIILLWMSFALTINHSLKWLNKHPALPIFMGLIGGPLSYLAGLKFGAVEYLQSTLLTSILLGLAWAASLTVLVKLSYDNGSKRINA